MFIEIIFPDSLNLPWQIIDDDFTNTVSYYGFSNIIINTYEERNLPVAINLVKAIVWWNKKSGYPVYSIVDAMKEQCSKYEKYSDEVNKYLILL